MTDPLAPSSAAWRDALTYVDAHAEEAIELLQRLMRLDSANPPGNERPIADVCAAEARELGMVVEQVEPAPGRVSNICRLPGRRGGPVLMFNSHLDTPALGDPSAWAFPPLAAERHHEAIWGLGARSAKAGLAATLFALRAVRAAGPRLDGDVLHVQTADELGGGALGWARLIGRTDLQADFGVFTEANPPAKVEIAARGMLQLDLIVTGFARHTKYKVEPTLGRRPVNAVAKMARVIEIVEAMEFSAWTPHTLVPGPPVISVNRVHGGFSDTLMADRCVARADCRFLPGQSPEQVVADLWAVLERAMAQDPDLHVEVSVIRQAPALEVDPDEPIVKAMQAAIHEGTGQDLPLGGVGSTSDMRWMVNELGIPSCKFMFPTSETGTDEHESIADYLDTIRVYVCLIVDLLTAPA